MKRKFFMKMSFLLGIGLFLSVLEARNCNPWEKDRCSPIDYFHRDCSGCNNHNRHHHHNHHDCYSNYSTDFYSYNYSYPFTGSTRFFTGTSGFDSDTFFFGDSSISLDTAEEFAIIDAAEEGIDIGIDALELEGLDNLDSPFFIFRPRPEKWLRKARCALAKNCCSKVIKYISLYEKALISLGPHVPRRITRRERETIEYFKCQCKRRCGCSKTSDCFSTYSDLTTYVQTSDFYDTDIFKTYWDNASSCFDCGNIDKCNDHVSRLLCVDDCKERKLCQKALTNQDRYVIESIIASSEGKPVRDWNGEAVFNLNLNQYAEMACSLIQDPKKKRDVITKLIGFQNARGEKLKDQADLTLLCDILRN